VESSAILCGRYQLGECLGQGGIGEVRAGRDLLLQRDVAVKLLHADMVAQPGMRQRFQVEAQAAASLVHPHVVAVFDRGEEAGVPFLVMERLSGRTLADRIAEGPMSPAEVRAAGAQIVDALTAVHRVGLMHRDIKPANVLAAGPGEWKLGDFGIAKNLEVGADLTMAGFVVGTPAYQAPERQHGDAATPSGELYAVGVVLYEALLGQRARGPLQPLDEVRPGLPSDLVAVVTQATAHDPADRFPSAAAMAEALVERHGADDVVARHLVDTLAMQPDMPGTEVMPVQLRPLPPFGANSPLPRRPKRSLRERRGVIAAAAVGTVVLVSALVISLGSHGGAATTSTSTSVAAVAPRVATPVAPRVATPAVPAPPTAAPSTILSASSQTRAPGHRKPGKR